MVTSSDYVVDADASSPSSSTASSERPIDHKRSIIVDIIRSGSVVAYRIPYFSVIIVELKHVVSSV